MRTKHENEFRKFPFLVKRPCHIFVEFSKRWLMEGFMHFFYMHVWMCQWVSRTLECDMWPGLKRAYACDSQCHGVQSGCQSIASWCWPWLKPWHFVCWLQEGRQMMLKLQNGSIKKKKKERFEAFTLTFCNIWLISLRLISECKHSIYRVKRIKCIWKTGLPLCHLSDAKWPTGTEQFSESKHQTPVASLHTEHLHGRLKHSK